jgi:DNA-binding MarR family transcriptional regulator
MEGFELHNLEAPTGIEIIKRLLKNGLATEFDDENDKRAKRIQVTKKGLKAVQMLEPDLNQIFSNFTEKLDLNDRIQLAAILKKMIKEKQDTTEAKSKLRKP